MILLLGGTSETAAVAEALARAGYRVLVSNATDVPLHVGTHSFIEVRSGPLDQNGLASLVRQRNIRAIVDVAHPYAVTVHACAARVADAMNIPCLALERPSCIDPSDPSVEVVPDHTTAAKAAFQPGRPVLLTTGSRNLAPYVREARRTSVSLVVRVLNDEASKQACVAAGLGDHDVLTGRGPFSVETNQQQIRQYRIGVLVTKDSGLAGGTPEKLAAAAMEGCRVIVVERPEPSCRLAVPHAAALIEQLQRDLGG